MNKPIVLSAILALTPVAAMAQGTMDDDTDSEWRSDMSTSTLGPEAGERELTLAGTGAGDKEFDNGNFGISGDLGWYLSEELELGIRQSFNYAQLEGASDSWSGATRGFVNYHFPLGAARPFVGANIGGVYGDGVEETGFAGPEAGLKYYVREKTFIFVRAEYQFFFESSDEVDDNFDDGSFVYSAGLGYHF